MKRAVLAVLAAVLAIIISLRAEGPSAPADLAAAAWSESGYNVVDRPMAGNETAGSGAQAELESWFLSRTPTAKNDCTGLLAGKDLILILAEDWALPAQAGPDQPALYRLWSEGAQITRVYAPDWYQGRDGREFALLTGMTPTTVQAETALARTGREGIYLPFALARALVRAGYDCRAFPDRAGNEAAYEALGFGGAETPGQSLAARLEELAAGRPYFAYWVLPGGDGETALEAVISALDGLGLDRDTAVCLVTGSSDPLRGHIFLWGDGLAGRLADGPCSELDLAPTLLNLLGAEMDSRYFFGRDLFAPVAEEAGPLVSLTGSAFSDWVTDKGAYDAAENAFAPAAGTDLGTSEQARYAARIREEVYDRYVYARRVLETDHFRAVG